MFKIHLYLFLLQNGGKAIFLFPELQPVAFGGGTCDGCPDPSDGAECDRFDRRGRDALDHPPARGSQGTDGPGICALVGRLRHFHRGGHVADRHYSLDPHDGDGDRARSASSGAGPPDPCRVRA